MPILVGIDGTGGGAIPGSARNARYDIDFANSFVSKLCKFKPNAQYNRGPVTLGGGLDLAIANGLRFIDERRAALGNDEPILLTGYSRGALGVMVIAQRLQRRQINVRASILFDCVDRHGDYDAEVVPNNVEHFFHVIRNPLANSRHSFGNDAMKYRPPTQYEGPYMFMCTHGGMGGTPWQRPANVPATTLIDEGASEAFFNETTAISYQQDEDVSKQVWNYSQIFMRTHRFIA
ncbi:hypothetical protein BH10ACI1_BH10ACI1_21330 [soil metagenome]